MNAPRKPARRRLDGVLLLDKALGLSSNHALQAARRLYNAEKAGHTGTLDPLATGLLPLCFGEATKFSGELLNADKRYVATVQLGVTTDTADAEGRVLQRRPVELGRLAVEAALAAFAGEIEQVPPMYSALKRDGKPLYEYARAGIEVERAARRVSIYQLRLLDSSGLIGEGRGLRPWLRWPRLPEPEHPCPGAIVPCVVHAGARPQRLQWSDPHDGRHRTRL